MPPAPVLKGPLRIGFSGDSVHLIYSDEVAPQLRAALGAQQVQIRRASHVEAHPDGSGWYADMSPVGGPRLDGFTTRGAALQAEVEYLQQNVIPNPATFSTS